jgi:hypothetical protein
VSDLGPDDPRPYAAPTDEERKAGLPPGAGTRGDPDDIDGNVRHERPFEDAPGEGRLAPDADNPPPPVDPGAA